MRCIANVLLKQKAKCILKNVKVLIQNESAYFPKGLEEFEVCVDKFYSDFIFSNRDVKVALEEFTDIFQKYNVESIVPKRMLLLMFENVIDYLDLIDHKDLFHWYYLVAKLILVNIMIEEYTNSLTEKKVSLDKVISKLKRDNRDIFDEEVSLLFEKNYYKVLKNITKNNQQYKKCLNELSKSPLRVKYDIIGEFDGKVNYISKITFDESVFKGIDMKHAFDSFQRYGFSNDFKYIEAEHVSFEVIKNVFANSSRKLYFIKLPEDFFRLKTNITKLNRIIEPKTMKYFVFLVPYDEIINRDLRVKDLKELGYKIGVYNLNKIETKSIKLKGIVDYVYFRPSLVTNYEEVVNFARSINCILIENERDSYKIYK